MPIDSLVLERGAPSHSASDCSSPFEETRSNCVTREKQVPAPARTVADPVTRIREEALQKRLRLDNRFWGVRVTLENDVLQLRGTLPSFYSKQVAQELFRDLRGRFRLSNEIEVVYQEQSPRWSAEEE